MPKPFQTECANADERFTCPGCYSDLPRGYGTKACNSCGRSVNCSKRMVPSYVATLVDDMQSAGEDDGGDEGEDGD